MKNDFKKLVEDVKSSEARSTTNAEMASPALDKESVKSLEYLSNEYDDLHRFRNSSKQQMSRLESRLTVLAEKVENLAKSIDEAEQYSYAYNVKMLGIPEFTSNETAAETSQLCVDIFNAVGANVSIADIDIAHRVKPRRSNGSQPKPIVCKFIRRLAREQVMAVRQNIKKIDPTRAGLSRETSMEYAGIYDHLTPKRQQLLVAAKKFKSDNNFSYCWTKNSTIYLRKTKEARAIKINDNHDLETLMTEQGQS
jgi:hypothetical protein